MDKIKYIPVIQIYLSIVSVFSPFGFWAYDTVGYSMLSCLVYWYVFNKESIFIRDCIIGLFIMNLVSLCRNFTEYDNYAIIYDLSIFILAHVRLIRYARKN